MNHLAERELICEIGRRLYAREFVAAHEGNLSIRLSDGDVLCTPTMHCKGFLQPNQLCLIDINGKQVDTDATTRPTSEMRLHLEIYRQRPDVNAVVHSHPNHATAFAVAHRPFPPCYLAEPDLFLGEIALAPFETPGTEAFARSITPYVKKTNAILLANHGVVTYGAELEKALWMTEVLESACKTLILSMAIGGPKPLTAEQGRALALKRADFGFHDPRDLNDPNLDPGQHPLFEKQLEDQGFGINWFDRRNNG